MKIPNDPILMREQAENALLDLLGALNELNKLIVELYPQNDKAPIRPPTPMQLTRGISMWIQFRGRVAQLMVKIKEEKLSAEHQSVRWQLAVILALGGPDVVGVAVHRIGRLTQWVHRRMEGMKRDFEEMLRQQDRWLQQLEIEGTLLGLSRLQGGRDDGF